MPMSSIRRASRQDRPRRHRSARRLVARVLRHVANRLDEDIDRPARTAAPARSRFLFFGSWHVPRPVAVEWSGCGRECGIYREGRREAGRARDARARSRERSGIQGEGARRGGRGEGGRERSQSPRWLRSRRAPVRARHGRAHGGRIRWWHRRPCGRRPSGGHSRRRGGG